MSTKKLQQALARWSREKKPLVLATVYETAGSTYSKTGAQMLITGDGLFQGMLSGGCLEGDLAERAAKVAASGEAQAVTYDLGQNDEELWGLGVGCDGLMRIFLQPLYARDGYEPLASICSVLDGDRAELALTVIESEHDDFPPGASLVTRDVESAFNNIDAALVDQVDLTADLSGITTTQIEDKAVTYLTSRLEPPPRILVLGGGLDAEPVVRLCDELGWRITVADHRPAYIDKGDFSAAEDVRCCAAAAVSAELDLERFAATIVMSHHLDSDRTYLRQLAQTNIAYIGLLGPIDRRRRLMDEIGEDAGKLADRIHGPAGLDLGGRGPAPIALSIVAEMHRFLSNRSH